MTIDVSENRITLRKRGVVLKRILICDQRNELLSTLEIILKNWGYRALPISDSNEFKSMMKELEPELIISGPGFITEKGVAKILKESKAPFILVNDSSIEAETLKATEELDYPVDIFRLFELTQKYLEKIPRRNIRLKVQLPGMYYCGESPCIAEIISLSAEGLFFRTGSRIDGPDNVQIVLPLLGMQKELEIKGRIVYRVEPQAGNNYLQGMGIEFIDIAADTEKLLRQYVENLLMTELSDKSYAQDTLDIEQLQSRSTELTLKINPID